MWARHNRAYELLTSRDLRRADRGPAGPGSARSSRPSSGAWPSRGRRGALRGDLRRPAAFRDQLAARQQLSAVPLPDRRARADRRGGVPPRRHREPRPRGHLGLRARQRLCRGAGPLLWRHAGGDGAAARGLARPGFRAIWTLGADRVRGDRRLSSIRDIRELHTRQLRPLMAAAEARRAVLAEAERLMEVQAAARAGQGAPVAVPRWFRGCVPPPPRQGARGRRPELSRARRARAGCRCAAKAGGWRGIRPGDFR